MTDINFSAKTICDNVHGSIGVSELELSIINTRTFQRLKKIKQLGLASYVFPGAEHSRFAHSIGAMHVMSQMVDGLRKCGCEPLRGKYAQYEKQKLRLAALLHDIGHYPLSHLGERAFQWADSFKATPVTQDSPTDETNLLAQATETRESEEASHERIGELILTHENSELSKLVNESGFDPTEIAKIINGETQKNVFYSQLMSSTLDCDRIDFLLRDSLATGTSYGKVDINYILQNIRWDDSSGVVCFDKKATNAIEHFVMARYFMYQIYFHKTIVGLELMAKALFFSMIQDESLVSKDYGEIVKSVEDIRRRIKEDENFLANFNDEYFWFYLDLWNPPTEVLKKLKASLLNRVPLRPIHEVRHFYTVTTTSVACRYLEKNLLRNIYDSVEHSGSLIEAGVSPDLVCVLSTQIKLEKLPYLSTYQSDPPEDDKKLKLIKILRDDEAKDLMSLSSSILKVLSDYKLGIARVYALLERDSPAEELLREVVKDTIQNHVGQDL